MDINILLFQGFETLDAFGPVEIFGRIEEYHLHYISVDGGVVSSRQRTEILTKPLADANYSGTLLIPGGLGTRTIIQDTRFIEQLTEFASQSTYCLTVCTGSALLAKTGLLDGRSATSNKRAFEWVKSINSNVNWIDRARWVTDGKFYTSSGVSAGMDMALGFVSDRIGPVKAREVADGIEYIWNSNKNNDQFAREIHCL